jgi:dienelactone hydrolase
MTRGLLLVVLVMTVCLGCERRTSPSAPEAVAQKSSRPAPVDRTHSVQSLSEARRGFVTKLRKQERSGEPLEQPPPDLFRVVQYESPVGQLAAYLSVDPQDGRKHPAIVWITGGDCATIGDVWNERPPKNDQSASAYRQAGIVMLYPSLRGGNENPGVHEGFYGEVDDVLAAADFLAQQSFVDPQRIYLGGHSTGGTLALLVTEHSPRFRATFSFGPVDEVLGYGLEFAPYDFASQRELDLRNPGKWLHSIRSPTFVLEGTDSPGNRDDLEAMAVASTNPQTHFIPVPGANHFSILAPVNKLLAEKILRDDGPTTNIQITAEELNALFAK